MSESYPRLRAITATATLMLLAACAYTDPGVSVSSNTPNATPEAPATVPNDTTEHTTPTTLACAEQIKKLDLKDGQKMDITLVDTAEPSYVELRLTAGHVVLDKSQDKSADISLFNEHPDNNILTDSDLRSWDMHDPANIMVEVNISDMGTSLMFTVIPGKNNGAQIAINSVCSQTDVVSA